MPRRPRRWQRARPRARRAWSARRRDRPARAARFGGPRPSAAWSSLSPSSTSSMVWMVSNRAAAFLALFDCRWPTRCQRSGRSARRSIFWIASWTLFSPKSIWPASAAARTCSASKVFETATRRMEDGSRRARSAARAMRSRTSANRARSAAESSTLTSEVRASTYLLELRDESLGGRGVGTLRCELQIGFELGGGAREVPFVHERHAELVVRLGVIRIRLNRRLERLLGVGDLAAVPQHDALVEERVRAARRAAGGAERRRQLRRLGAGGRRQIELALRVVDAREAGVRIGVVGLQLDRLLVVGFGVVVVLLLRVARSRCCRSTRSRWAATPPPS